MSETIQCLYPLTWLWSGFQNLKGSDPEKKWYTTECWQWTPSSLRGWSVRDRWIGLVPFQFVSPRSLGARHGGRRIECPGDWEWRRHPTRVVGHDSEDGVDAPLSRSRSDSPYRRLYQGQGEGPSKEGDHECRRSKKDYPFSFVILFFLVNKTKYSVDMTLRLICVLGLL